MTAKIDGTNGLLQAYDYQVLTTGFSYTFAAGTQTLVINPAGTLATGTITMPASPVDGMVITFSSTKQVTALTLNGNTGQSVVSGVSVLPANQATSYVYRLASTSWYPITTVATNTPITGGGSYITSGTAVSASGTSVDFTGIPSWVKRITVMVAGLSSNSTSPYLVQLGDSGGIETSGYSGAVSWGGGGATSWFSTGFNFFTTQYAASLHSGNITLTLLGSNTWTETSNVAQNATGVPFYGAGHKQLSDTLTQIRVTTVNGTDTFDAGSINILYE